MPFPSPFLAIFPKYQFYFLLHFFSVFPSPSILPINITKYISYTQRRKERQRKEKWDGEGRCLENHVRLMRQRIITSCPRRRLPYCLLHPALAIRGYRFRLRRASAADAVTSRFRRLHSANPKNVDCYPGYFGPMSDGARQR